MYAAGTPTLLPPPPPVTLRDLGRVLRRRALLACVTFIVVVGTTLAFTSQMKPVYEAKSRILLDSPTAAGTPSKFLDLLGGGGGGSSLETEMEKIRSRDFLNEVIRKADLKETSPDDLKGRLRLGSGPGGQILEIGVRARTAEEAQTTANTTAQVYMDFARQEYEDKTDLSRSRMRIARKVALEEKKNAEERLTAFYRQVGQSDPAIYYNERAQKTVKVKDDLEEARRQLPVLETELRNRRDQVKRISPELIGGYSQNKNVIIDSYTEQVVALERKRRLFLLDYQPDAPEVKQVEEEIATLKELRRQAETNPYSVGSKSVMRNPDYSKAQSAVYDAEHAIRMTRKNIGSYEALLGTLEAEQKQLAVQKNEYEQLRRNMEAANTAYFTTNEGLLKMEVTRPTSLPNFRLLDAAQLPPSPVSPKPVLNALMALALGLFLSIGMALFAEYMATADTPEGDDLAFLPELPQAGGVPLLGVVPASIANTLPPPVRTQATGDWELPAPLAYNGAIASSASAPEDVLREIGYNLAHRHGSDLIPVVVLTSTHGGDATAALAARLSATLVRDGLRVTLVDADRSRPRLNKVFGAPDAPGVADVLAGRRKLKDALHVGADGSLRFLAAGSPEDNAPATDKGWQTLFKELASPAQTDIVIVSGPSVWSVPAIAPLEKAATGLVLLTGPGSSPGESVARVRRLLSNGYKPRIMGVVVEDASPASLGASDVARPALVDTVGGAHDKP